MILTMDDKFITSIESLPVEVLRQEVIRRVESMRSRLLAICAGLVEMREEQENGNNYQHHFTTTTT